LQAFLAGLGAVIAGGLLMAARRIGDGDRPVEFRLFTGLGHPAGIASWGLISTMLLIPSAILVLVFPGLVAL
jgi:hypothetical protein